jgi:hypothetical protein
MERRYWNEDLETLQPAALHQLENDYLRTQLDYVWAGSAEVKRYSMINSWLKIGAMG